VNETESIQVPSEDPSAPIDRGAALPAPEGDPEPAPEGGEQHGNRRVFKFGDEGDDVKAAQEELGIIASGVFDERTERHVKNLQRAEHPDEDPDGVLRLP
jgi:hypothetical protein